MWIGSSMDRAKGFYPLGWGFESLPIRQLSPRLLHQFKSGWGHQVMDRRGDCGNR